MSEPTTTRDHRFVEVKGWTDKALWADAFGNGPLRRNIGLLLVVLTCSILLMYDS